MKAISSTPTNLLGTVNYSGGGTYSLTGLTIGVDYVWLKGANDTSCTVTTTSLILAASGVFTATATSVTLTGTASQPVTAVVCALQPIRLYASTFTPTQPTKQVQVGQFPESNPNWSRVVQVSNEAVYGKRGTYGVALNLADFLNQCLAQEPNLTWTPPVILQQPVNVACASTASSTGTLTGSGSTNVSDGDTVTIGGQVYRFKNAMSAINDVQIGGSGNSDTSLLNLIDAINGTGTAGTNWFAGTVANASVSAAASVTSHAFAVTALVAGTSGNTVGTTKSSTVLSWGGATLAGGTVAAAYITVVQGSEYTVTYQWQYSANGTTGWTNCAGTVNGCAYTNATTAMLTCTPTTNGQSGYFHQCLITDDAGSFGLTNGVATSKNATLTIP